MYGDWQLVITAYQVGNGTLDKIIARRGGKKDYWALRPYLPKYASEYMAKFFAVCYVLEYHETMGITPLEAKFNPAKLDTIQITQPIGFERMSKALNIEKSDISKLNPQYKQNFVPNENNLYVILPKEAAAVFREDPNKIYHFKLNK
jgi:membrane-bound lytic murein transglycosylase D